MNAILELLNVVRQIAMSYNLFQSVYVFVCVLIYLCLAIERHHLHSMSVIW